MNKFKGFTIIELLVVIAIIAVLAAVVLINVAGYINKSKDSKMISEMHTVQVNGMASATTDGLYPPTVTLCSATAGTAWASILVTHGGALGANAKCAVNTADNTDGSGPGTKWCACALKLSETKYWCVDSTGFAGLRTTSCLTACSATKDNTCPAS